MSITLFCVDTNEVHAVGEAGSVDADDRFVGIEGIQEFAVNVVNFNSVDDQFCIVNYELTSGWVRIYADVLVEVVSVDADVGGGYADGVGRIGGETVGAVSHNLDVVFGVAGETGQGEWNGSSGSGAPNGGAVNAVLNIPVGSGVGFLFPSQHNVFVVNFGSGEVCRSRTGFNTFFQGVEEYWHSPVGGAVSVASSLYAYEVLGVSGQTGEVVVWCSVYNHAGPVETLLVFVFEVPGGFVATSGPVSACGGLSDVVNS